MEEYTFHPEESKKTTKPIVSSTGMQMFKVYLWFALGLLITGVISLVIPNVFIALLSNESVSAETVGNVYTGMMIVSIIAMIPSWIILSIQSFRKNFPLMLTFYIIYTAAMGVLLSSVMLMFVGTGSTGITTICVAFLATALVFLIMGLIGSFTKANMNILYPFIAMVAMGAIIISLVNFFVGSTAIYWIVDFVIFGVMVIVVGIDTYNIKKIAERGGLDNKNLALYCAYSLYTDFIWIFIRILYYIIIFANNK